MQCLSLKIIAQISNISIEIKFKSFRDKKEKLCNLV